MRPRAAAIILEAGAVAVIERHRGGRHYFTFPGGGVDEGETPEQAVVREVLEELGLQIRVIRRVAEVWFRGSRQDHFLAERTGGVFGTGHGDEYSADYPSGHGTYNPLWMPLAEVPLRPLLPAGVAALLVGAVAKGWPAEPVVIHEPVR